MISVIVPAYNAASTLPACLKALAAQDWPEDNYEVIVVDDGSSDSTAKIVQQTDARLVSTGGNRGAAAARNAGIRVAQGTICFFTDADCVPDRDWLASMAQPFREDGTVHGVKGIYRSEQRELVARFVQLEYEDKYDLMKEQSTIDFIDTYSAAYRRDIFERYGRFDEALRYIEDQEFSFRLAAEGCKMVFQPTAVVAHIHSDSLRKYARKKFTIGTWKARFIKNYPDRLVKDSHTPQSLKVQMGLAGLACLLLAASLTFPPLMLLCALTILIFLLTTVPFVRKAWPKDRSVALSAPLLLAIRALALGFGFAWGSVRPLSHDGTTEDTYNS